jgi:hypothetical protein
MFDRIFKNWKTSALGLAIILTCFVFLWFEKTTLADISIFFAGGFLLLFAKDNDK